MPTTPQFRKAYGQLNPRQKDAVDALDGPVMVVAGPGTGKTQVLTLRIANIILKTDTPPEAILALTFTESAAAQMRRRLADLIGTDAYRVNVTTFHAFCNSVILDHPESFRALAGADALDDAERTKIITELIASTDGISLLCPPNAPDLYVRAAISAIQTLKREAVPPARLAAIATAQERRIDEVDDLRHAVGPHGGKMKGKYVEELTRARKLGELATLFTAYEKALTINRRYDYEDMISQTAAALEKDEQLRLSLQERFHYLLVDEHQDTNNAQNRVIELLASYWERPNLFVVGDAKQAIFRFQGASLENFRYFKDKFRDVQLISLDRNYRSLQPILNAAEGVRPSESKLQGRAGKSPIEVYALSDEHAERFAIADIVRSWLSQKIEGHEIAVLVRENADATSLGELLSKAGIPHETSSDIDAFNDPFVAELLVILDAVTRFGDVGSLLRAVTMPVLGIDPLDQYRLAIAARSRDVFKVLGSRVFLKKAGITNPERVDDVLRKLRTWSAQKTTPDALPALEAVVRESGILATAVASENAQDALAKLHAIYDLARRMVARDSATTLEQFVEHIRFMRQANIGLPASGAAGRPGRVRVLTAHKCKGLEFDRVIIANASDGHWGGRGHRALLPLPPEVFGREGRDAPVPDEDGDERNLFYVALTRARDRVVITYAQRDDADREQLVSRFVRDITAALLSSPDTATLEEGWASRRDLVWAERTGIAVRHGDKEFVREQFLSIPFSVTALNNYLTCPWRYFYSSLIRIPEAPAFALLFGTAVDHALTDFFEAFRKGKKPRKRDLLELFSDHAHRQPLGEREEAAALIRGRKALDGWYERYHTTWDTKILNQLRIPAVAFELPKGEELLLTGKMDRVDLMKAGVVVVDYKTGRPKSRKTILGETKTSDGSYWRQLVFYRLLLDRYQKGIYRMSCGVLDFVEPDERGTYHREMFEVSDAHVAYLENEIRRVAEEIMSLAFWNSRCDDPRCTYCALRNLAERKAATPELGGRED